jgi:transposase
MVKIKQLQRKIEAVAATVEAVDFLRSAPGVAKFSGFMIYGEFGDVDRFVQTNRVVSYAGVDSVVRESGASGY